MKIAIVLLLAACAPETRIVKQTEYVTDWSKCEAACAPYHCAAAVRIADDEGFYRCADGDKVQWRMDEASK